MWRKSLNSWHKAQQPVVHTIPSNPSQASIDRLGPQHYLRPPRAVRFWCERYREVFFLSGIKSPRLIGFPSLSILFPSYLGFFLPFFSSDRHNRRFLET